MSTEETIFTKIIKRELPSTIIYEDEESIAFVDIFPVSKGHILVVSKEPYKWMTDVPDELLGRMFITAKKLMSAIREGLKCDFVQVTVEGINVPHFHIHLMPRYHNDGFARWPTIKYETDEEKIEYAEKIKRSL